MDATVLVLQCLVAAFVVWGAFLCIARRDRRGSVLDRRASIRAAHLGRRRGDLARLATIEHAAAAVNEDAMTARKRRLAA